MKHVCISIPFNFFKTFYEWIFVAFFVTRLIAHGSAAVRQSTHAQAGRYRCRHSNTIDSHPNGQSSANLSMHLPPRRISLRDRESRHSPRLQDDRIRGRSNCAPDRIFCMSYGRASILLTIPSFLSCSLPRLSTALRAR